MFKSTTAKTPEEYINSLDELDKSEIYKLHRIILKNVPKLKPFIISGMIGYGKYHYKYASGREGEWSIIALAKQKNYISLYVCCIDENQKYLAEAYKEKLPKANIGKSCIRFKNLEDVNLQIITEILLKAEKIGGMAAVK